MVEPLGLKKIPCMLQRASQNFPNEYAVITEHQRLTFLELEQQVKILSRYFRQRGITSSDRVMVALPNSVPLLSSLLALMRIGALCCPVNPKFPYPQQLHIKETINARWTITESIHTEDSVALDIITLTSIEQTLKNNEMPVDSTPINYFENKPCCLILTSGTSGQPKAVAFAYQQLYFSALGANERIPLDVGDRNLISLPMFHVGGLAIVFRCLLAGATMVIGGNEDLLASLHKFSVTHASMVATQLRRLLKARESELISLDPLSLKAVLIGGGPVDETLLEQAHATGLKCWHTYGLTEMASQVYTSEPLGEGKVLNYREMILNDQHEICVKGETLFLGYYQQGRLNLPLNSEGWFETKDLGRITKGRLDVIGRIDNQFISGGENIQPEEIEYYVNRLTGVEQCIVVPLQHPEYGFRPVIFIDSAEAILLSDLRKQLALYLPSFKIPTAVYSWVSSNSLKVSRNQLRMVANGAEVIAG